MNDIAGIPMKRFIEAILALVGLILCIVEKMSAKSHDFILFAITFSYLALIVVMSCMNRGVGDVASIEGALGVLLIIHCILALLASQSTTIMIAYILYLIVGIMFLVFMIM